MNTIVRHRVYLTTVTPEGSVLVAAACSRALALAIVVDVASSRLHGEVYTGLRGRKHGAKVAVIGFVQTDVLELHSRGYKGLLTMQLGGFCEAWQRAFNCLVDCVPITTRAHATTNNTAPAADYAKVCQGYRIGNAIVIESALIFWGIVEEHTEGQTLLGLARMQDCAGAVLDERAYACLRPRTSVLLGCRFFGSAAAAHTARAAYPAASTAAICADASTLASL